MHTNYRIIKKSKKWLRTLTLIHIFILGLHLHLHYTKRNQKGKTKYCLKYNFNMYTYKKIKNGIF
jgi:hypothetical protein